MDKATILQIVGHAVKVKTVDDERRRLENENRNYQVNLEAIVEERTSQLQLAMGQLKNAQAQMVREERLSALGQMASGIAHDFNNALVPIVGYSEMLVSRPEILANPDESLVLVKAINTAAQDAKQIVKRLRLIRGSEEGIEYVPLNVNEIMRGAVEMTRPRWDKEMGAKGNRIDLVTSLEADKQVMGNESELREALINLILNAVDAMPGGRTLTMSSGVEGEDVIVAVSDTGEGMTDVAKERCLEAFFTTKGAKRMGLGMSMVHGIVTRHKGTMKVDSTLGQGTTVQIRLPCAPAESVAEESTKTKAGEDTTIPPLRILVADDEANSRILIERFLKKDGHVIEMARNGREAMDKASTGTFDLVITDCSMPEANGDQVALAVKARTPGTPVILLTGFGDIMKDKGDCPVGVDRILSKPMTRLDLRCAIAEVMEKEGRVLSSQFLVRP